jgi:uncharacterized protein (DUF1330 family)
MRMPGCLQEKRGMTAYVIYQGVIHDAERYAEYVSQVVPNITGAGGRFVVVGGDGEALEGELSTERTIILEFPSRQAALDWYSGEDYTRIRKIRESAARGNLYVLDGVD